MISFQKIATVILFTGLLGRDPGFYLGWKFAVARNVIISHYNLEPGHE